MLGLALRLCLAIQRLRQHVQQRRTDVARHSGAHARALQQQTGERGHGGFAVGAGDGQHLRVVRPDLALRQLAQREREQIQLADPSSTICLRPVAQWRELLWRQARAACDHLPGRLGQQRSVERTAAEPRRRTFGTQGSQLWWVVSRVGHRHPRALAQAPARHRQAGNSQAQDENGLVFQRGHRSFNVDRPTRHSSMVTIQKRTTTCVSFQPFFSKWWCSGAIWNRRLPWPKRRLVYLK